ncbi:hypothetical protein PV326_004665 [Microctonus aethiopoides]|nr:hypothetical protein PV326_004665 [Microctonus aethiopoides]
MRELFDTIKDDWLIVKKERTNEIIQRYAEMGKNISLSYVSVLSLSITGMQTTLNLNNPSEALQAGVLCFGHIIHIYYYSWNSQKILDHSSTIFDATYNTEWYTVLDKTTKLVMFMMLRCTRPCIQTAGKIFPMTLMNFTVINNNWNMLAIRAEKLVGFMLVRFVHSCKMATAGFHVIKMENFGSV